MINENGERVDQNRNILDEIAEFTKERVALNKAVYPMECLIEEVNQMAKGKFEFEEALKESQMSFICEIKKASPSKGLIAPDFPYLEIAKDYEKSGATAISCLTEPNYFQGKDRYLKEIAAEVTIPILRKDFFVDEYMIYEAKAMGASAILLICAILDDEELKQFFALAEELGMSAIFEAHDEEEVLRAAKCGARIIGVNNRNLKTFELNLQNSIRLRELVNEEILFISESGIKTREDIETLETHHVDAVLVGETLMRAADKKMILDTLKGI